MSSRLGISCTTGIIKIWLEFTVKYTCYSFTFISFQYFKPIHLTLNDLLVTFPATFHNSFLLYFHNWPVFSVSSVPGPAFCSEKNLSLSSSSMLSSDFFSSALPCILYSSVSRQPPLKTRFIFSQNIHCWRKVGKTVSIKGIVFKRTFYHGFPLVYVFLNTGSSGKVQVSWVVR